MTLTTRIARLLFLAMVAAPLGCSDGGQVNIGNTDTLGGKLSDYAATWDGYTQLSTFSDGSDRVRLTIDAEGHGRCRSATARRCPPRPMRTSGIRPAPETCSWRGSSIHRTRDSPIRFTGRVSRAVGFQLGDRLQRRLRGLVRIQTPVSTGTDADTGAETFGCSPPFTMIEHANPSSASCVVTKPDGTTQVADCGWLTLCSFPATTCTCTATACTAALVPDGAPGGQYPFQFDGRLDATGSTLSDRGVA